MTWSQRFTVPVLCRKCGHSAATHRMNDCAHIANNALPCDCDGWDRDPWDELPREDTT